MCHQVIMAVGDSIHHLPGALGDSGVVGCLVGWVVGGLVGWIVSCLAGYLVVWSLGLVGCLVLSGVNHR